MTDDSTSPSATFLLYYALPNLSCVHIALSAILPVSFVNRHRDRHALSISGLWASIHHALDIPLFILSVLGGVWTLRHYFGVSLDLESWNVSAHVHFSEAQFAEFVSISMVVGMAMGAVFLCYSILKSLTEAVIRYNSLISFFFCLSSCFGLF